MIWCIWYPSGGFGHFINAIISLYGNNFCRPENNNIFGDDGNSHSLKLILPKYKDNFKYGLPTVDSNKNYTVLIDNGINNESRIFQQTFPDSRTIKLCYDDEIWPVVAQTHIIKAMKSTLLSEMDISEWDTKEPWAWREKYFLYLRDHNLRHKWKPSPDVCNLNINELQNYNQLVNNLKSFGIAISSFQSVWNTWWHQNHRYFRPVVTARHVINELLNEKNISLEYITDTWEQAVLYYF